MLYDAKVFIRASGLWLAERMMPPSVRARMPALAAGVDKFTLPDQYT